VSVGESDIAVEDTQRQRTHDSARERTTPTWDMCWYVLEGIIRYNGRTILRIRFSRGGKRNVGRHLGVGTTAQFCPTLPGRNPRSRHDRGWQRGGEAT
jgi:hypothetical protein